MPSFNELIKLLKKHGGKMIREKGAKQFWLVNGQVVRVDYHGSKEVAKGTYHKILKKAGIEE